MASPKKPGPKKDPSDIDVGPQTIKDVFKGFYGPEKVNDEASEEFFNLLAHERLRIESEKDILEARRRRRIERREEKKRKEEEQRLWKKRNNPENLSLCAAQIQKYWRMIPMRRAYDKIKHALSDHQKKKAIVIIGDKFEDHRMRAPTATVQEGIEIAKILQGLRFEVDIYSCNAANSQYLPTKNNISRALADAAQTPQDTLLWVHMCGLGTTATVQGKNPHKEAEIEQQKLRTPRTRLLHALATSHRAAGSGQQVGDVRHFFFPSDAKSSRLTFESVISLEEVLDILHHRHSEVIHGHALHQRMLTVDVAEMGAVDGQQGGGYALMASSATGEALYEMPRAAQNTDLVEPLRATLSWGIVQCLLGEAWAYDARLETAKLTMNNLHDFIEKLFDAQGISAARKGKRWGEIPIVLGDRGGALHSFYSKAFGKSCVGLPGPDGVVGTPVDTATQSPAPAGLGTPDTLQQQSSLSISSSPAPSKLKRKRNKKGHDHRSCLTEVIVRVDMTKEANRINIYDSDFNAILVPFLHYMSQADPTLPSHRQPKVLCHRIQPTTRLTIGIAGTFVDVAAKCKVRGGETAMWDDVAASLTADMELASNVEVCLGRAEEGGVALVMHVSTWEELDSVLNKLETIPTSLGGIEHSSVFVDITVECTCIQSATDQLNLLSRGIKPISRMAEGSSTPPPEGSDGQPAAHAQAAAFLSNSARDKHALRYGVHDIQPEPSAIEEHLDNVLGSSNLKNRNWIMAFARQKAIRIIEASPITQRINELDDQGMDALMRRDRPLGNPLPYTHTGLILGVVAFVGNTDSKLKQARELQKAAAAYELHFGFRFMLWDVNEALKNDARDHFPRERLAKLLEGIKFNLGPSAFPAVLVLDLFKKRFYRMRQQAPSPLFDVKTISHFCDEFVKGSLGELLPPVKGCRVFGGGVASTKYALIAI